MKVNMNSKGENKEFEPMPDGNYLFEVIGAEEGAGKAGPYTKITLSCRTAGHTNRQLYSYLSASAAWKCDQFLVAAGWDAADLTGEDFEFPPQQDLVGRMVGAQVLPPDEGYSRNNVGFFMKPEKVEGTAPASTEHGVTPF